MGNVPCRLAGVAGAAVRTPSGCRGFEVLVVPRWALSTGVVCVGRAWRTIGLGALTTIPGRAVWAETSSENTTARAGSDAAPRRASVRKRLGERDILRILIRPTSAHRRSYGRQSR